MTKEQKDDIEHPDAKPPALGRETAPGAKGGIDRAGLASTRDCVRGAADPFRLLQVLKPAGHHHASRTPSQPYKGLAGHSCVSLGLDVLCMP